MKLPISQKPGGAPKLSLPLSPFAKYLGLQPAAPAPSTATSVTRSLTSRAVAAAKQVLTGTARSNPDAKAPARSSAKASPPAAAPRVTAPKRLAQFVVAETSDMWPEMINGVATGRRVEIRRTTATEQPVNASEAAYRVIAAGERARGNTQTPFADAMASHLNPAKAAADRIIAAGERAFGKA